MFEEWVLGKSALPPTWPTLVGVLLGVHRPLGSEIENFFNTQTPMTRAVLPVHMLIVILVSSLHSCCSISQLVEQKKKKESPSSEEKSEGRNTIALRLAKGRHSYHRVSNLKYESVRIDSKTVVFIRANPGKKETTDGSGLRVNFIRDWCTFLEVVSALL